MKRVWRGAAGVVGAGVLVGTGATLAWAAAEFTPTQRAHWAWKAPSLPPVPKVRDAPWVANPIDAFILARLEARGLRPAPPASPEQLVRRVTFDLTGLPPTPSEVEAFVRECAAEDPAGPARSKASGRVGARESGSNKPRGRVGERESGRGNPLWRDSSPTPPFPHSPTPLHQNPNSSTAYERLVDRLLNDPRYGERWARHWLDLARYADTNGYEHDEVRPDAWRYRDYVVRSLNADKPYDRFIREQLAGDEVAPEDPDARIATGFNLLGPDMTDAADQAARRQNTLNDMTDTAGLVFLGLTAGCARCHDHKYEPILQTDYYRLQAFFSPARFRKDLPVATPAALQQHARAQTEYEARLREVRERQDAVGGTVRETLRSERLAKLPEDVRTAFRTPEKERTVEQQLLVERMTKSVEPAVEEVTAQLPEAMRETYKRLAEELRKVEAARPVLPSAMGLEDEPGAAAPTYVLERGELANRGAEVTAGFPVILAAAGEVPAAAQPVGRRSALARWIASPENPLTARVMVNRVWQHHFGRGILPTPSDFGLRGDSPTHPELLDYLAARFAGVPSSAASGGVSRFSFLVPRSPGANKKQGTRNEELTLGWSLKRLHRLILTSRAYRQSSHADRATLAADPDNELFSRMNRLRLEAEAIRDATLAISGRLNRKMGGPGVFPPMPEEARPRPGLWPVSTDPADHTRRSLYTFVRRNVHYPQFEAFDAPDTNLSCPRREVSTTAPQALALMNDPEILQSARSFAARVLVAAATEEARVVQAYRLALGRAPSPGEVAAAREFLKKQAGLVKGRPEQPLPKGFDAATVAAWADFCLALMNLNEFVYLD